MCPNAHVVRWVTNTLILLCLKTFCDYRENQGKHFRAEFIDGLFLCQKKTVNYRMM